MRRQCLDKWKGRKGEVERGEKGRNGESEGRKGKSRREEQKKTKF